MKFLFIIALYTIASKKSFKAFASHKDSIKTKANDGNYEELDVDGYYKFLVANAAMPPLVRPPPYFKSQSLCEGIETPFVSGTSNGNLCGDLNKGVIPNNPLQQSFDGDPYPFDLVTKSTLKFFNRALPILQNDESVPKVINYRDDWKFLNSLKNRNIHSKKRSKRQNKSTLANALISLKDFLIESTDILNITQRAKQFCETGNGMICLLYKTIQGESIDVSAEDRKDDEGFLQEEASESPGPPTPCPAKVEYATPVFARNYQGIWRYVVQIPYETYFTQTVEVVTCLGTRCHYLDGNCFSSPRWVSLLVAEIFYPRGLDENALLQEANTYSSLNMTLKADDERCDGVDKNGCYQVRIYYDWFLIPGSCKCWKPGYVSKYFN